MQITRMNVTPEMAQSWLDAANTGNRTMTRQVVSKYADDMIAGRWIDTHQNAIAFYDDGSLADGQHRLGAVAMAGISVQMFVAHGLDRRAGGVIDQGRARSTADAITIGRLCGLTKYVNEAVAMVRIVKLAETGRQTVMSAQNIADHIDRMAELCSYASHALSGAGGGIKNSPVRAAVAVASKFIGRNTSDGFCRVIVSGMPEKPEDATIITLRNRLMTSTHRKGGDERIANYRMVMRFIKAYDQGIILTVAKSTGELAYRLGVFDEK